MKRLLVVARDYAGYERWARSLDLRIGTAYYFSAHDKPDRFRGLSEHRVAFVFVDPMIGYSEKHHDIIAMYVGLGAPKFSGEHVDEIRAWLKEEA